MTHRIERVARYRLQQKFFGLGVGLALFANQPLAANSSGMSALSFSAVANNCVTSSATSMTFNSRLLMVLEHGFGESDVGERELRITFDREPIQLLGLVVAVRRALMSIGARANEISESLVATGPVRLRLTHQSGDNHGATPARRIATGLARYPARSRTGKSKICE